jgi:hypothetical protein
MTYMFILVGKPHDLQSVIFVTSETMVLFLLAILLKKTTKFEYNIMYCYTVNVYVYRNALHL